MSSIGCNQFETYFPCPELAPYVQCYSAFEVNTTEEEALIDEIVPGNLSALHFISDSNIYNFREADQPFRRLFPISVIGHIKKKAYSKLVGWGTGVLVMFTSIGLFHLFGINMEALGNTFQDATNFICSKDITECWQAIFNCQTAAERVGVAEAFLLSALHRNVFDMRGLDAVIASIHQQKGRAEIETLCKQANMSVKTFERHFYQKVGISPKLYCEIARFSNAYKMLQANKTVFQVIETCGYSDQAHMIREFKKFTDGTPKCYYKTGSKSSDYFVRVAVQE